MFGVGYAEFDCLNKRFRLTDLPSTASRCCCGAFSLLYVTGIEEMSQNVLFSFSSSNQISAYCPLVDGNDFSRLGTALVYICRSIMCPSFLLQSSLCALIHRNAHPNLQSSVACTSNGEHRGASGGRTAPGNKSILSPIHHRWSSISTDSHQVQCFSTILFWERLSAVTMFILQHKWNQQLMCASFQVQDNNTERTDELILTLLLVDQRLLQM